MFPTTELIVCTGPESSGKSTLSKLLHTTLDYPLVTEQARSMLERTQGKYNFHSLQTIARKQVEAEAFALASNPEKVICDTDLLTILIWMEDKFDRMDQMLLEQWQKSSNRLYLLCQPDFPWEADPLREDPERRAELFQIYFNKLSEAGKHFVVVNGSVQQRLEQAIQSLNR